MKSPIKYVGGKAKLIKNKTLVFPENFNDYYEPFCGGMSPFLSLNSNCFAFISDNSENLMNFYQVLKYRPAELIQELKTNCYLKNCKTSYIFNRKRFNEINVKEHPIEKAALFLYLNKTGFNGMYRENKKGEFNIPFGNMKSPNWCDTENLLAVSKKLNDAILSCQDYSNISPKKGDLVYLDPPYYNTFSDYTKNSFGEYEHIQLYNKCVEWNSRGVQFILSNSNTEFILNLYKEFNITKIPIKYSISSGIRKSTFELLIKN